MAVARGPRPLRGTRQARGRHDAAAVPQGVRRGPRRPPVPPVMARSRLRAAREFFSLVSQTDPNQYGKAYGLTSFFPILPGHTDALEAHLHALEPEESPLGRLPQLHMSRLHVIRGLVYQGPPQIPETLDNDYLIFTVSIDGDDRRLPARLREPCSARTRTRSSPTPSASPARATPARSRAGRSSTSATTATSSPRGRSRPSPASTRRCASRRASASWSRAPPSCRDAELQAEFRALMAGGK